MYTVKHSSEQNSKWVKWVSKANLSILATILSWDGQYQDGVKWPKQSYIIRPCFVASRDW